MPKIAIILNDKSQETKLLADDIAEYLHNHDVSLKTPASKTGFSLDDLADDYDFTGVDAAIVLGGDGTVLASGRKLAYYDVPLMGINMGRLGFLSEVEKGDAYAAIDCLISGQYQIYERMLLRGVVIRDNREIKEYTAFNDIVVNNGMYVRSVMLDLLIDNEKINSYQADGIIVSTPTGSTGYSFSAGGPIVMTDTDLLLITPVCPHTFFSRSIVAPATSEVRIVCRSDSDRVSLTADGQYRGALHKDDVIAISASDIKVKMIKVREHSLFERIKCKLSYDFK